VPVERRALVVGIDEYQEIDDLDAAVADAESMGRLLRRHVNEEGNFDCRVLAGQMEDGSPITRRALRMACQKLFSPEFRGDALFYFSGHGVLTSVGGSLCTYDSEEDDWGVPMQEVVDWALHSNARDVLIILDCCHSGSIANPATLQSRGGSDPLALLRENMTVIAASHTLQASVEAGGHGLFTAAVLDALEGGAADHMGWVTAPSIYSYVDRRFGAWDQRPIYKSHATGVMVVRKCAPLIDRLKLRDLVKYFPSRDHRYKLDPEYEPEDEHGNVHEPVNLQKVAIAQLFKDYRDAGLLKPSILGEQLFWTARLSHSVELTARGREYWWLAANDKLR
jgi:hypothetical protein